MTTGELDEVAVEVRDAAYKVIQGKGATNYAIGLSSARIVLVHDAVRPLVPAAMVARVIDAVESGARAVTPALPVVDSLRRVERDGLSSPVDRSELRAIQTPQGFDFATLLDSHRAAAVRGVEATDDVGVCEAAGHQVTLVEGAATAFKITRAEDLELARALVALRQDEERQ
jgi:2-C-methyl-D-erythritol 4-phosphate cytidylyltransferase